MVAFFWKFHSSLSIRLSIYFEQYKLLLHSRPSICFLASASCMVTAKEIFSMFAWTSERSTIICSSSPSPYFGDFGVIAFTKRSKSRSAGAHTHTLTTASNGNHTHTMTTGNNSNVNAIYGASSTVQPPAVKVNYIIKF